MAKKQYYVVKKGKTPGIYFTWDDCKKQVLNFPGAIYKGFSTKEEAMAYAGDLPTTAKGEGTEKESKSIIKVKAGEALAYVDGSYNAATKEYSCGIVFFFEGKEEHICCKGDSEELATMRNVAGEIFGARLAMEKAVEYGAKKLTIVHDYQGIASWCTGEWKTNKEGTKAYKEYFDSIRDKILIQFEKVKGHSGDTYNDLADQLAKSVIF